MALITINSGNTIDSTAIASFKAKSSYLLKSLKVSFIPQQLGNGTPSSSNVRPINGYSTIKVEHRSRNLLINVAPSVSGYGLTITANGDGSMTINNTKSSGAYWFNWNTKMTTQANSVTQYQQERLLPNGRYYLGDWVDDNHKAKPYPRYSLDASNYDGTNTRAGTHVSVDSENCVTVDDNYRFNWMRMYMDGTGTFNNYTIYPKLFLASETDKSWTPANARVHTIALGDTYYGGEIDLITGVLTVKYGYISDLSALDGWTYGDNNRWYCKDTNITLKPKATLRQTWCISNKLETKINGESFDQTWDEVGYIVSQGSIYVHKTGVSTVDELKTFLSGISFAYELRTPYTVQLTPQQIRLLRGTNNVWSDQGDVEIQYEDILEKPIWFDKIKTIMNSPHYITVNWNQLAVPFETGYWQPYNSSYISITFNNGIMTVTNIQAGGGDAHSVRQTDGNGFRRTVDEVFYVSVMMNPSWDTRFVMELSGPGDRDYPAIAPANTWTRYSKIAGPTDRTREEAFAYVPEIVAGYSSPANSTEQLKCPVIVNLTQMFGAGKEPTAVEFEHQCIINGIDLTQSIQYNSGTTKSWRIS